MSETVAKTKALAEQKHGSEYIPDEARTPMIEHVAEVAGLVMQHGGTDAMVAAAWLHDVVEDTDVTLAQVAEWFGSEIEALVNGLTDPVHFAGLPLEQRKQLQADRLSGLDDNVKLIKLCDQLSNVRRVLNRPPDDWSPGIQWTYIQGARKITLHCRGIAPELDEQFDRAFAAARNRYS